MSKRCNKIMASLDSYGESATIHGLSYIFISNETCTGKNFIWSIAVSLAFFFAIWTSLDIYVSWKSDPVLTTIENFAYPIQNIKFPAVTICPQGADNSILRSVLFKQFNEYLAKKNLKLEDLSLEEAQIESKKFLNETYPGAKQSPDNYVTLFRAQNLNSNIKTQANINPEDQVSQCNSTLNKIKRRKRNSDTLVCPAKTVSDENGNCLHLSNETLTYSDAANYCKNTFNDHQADVYQFLEESDVTSLHKLYEERKSSFCNEKD